MELATQIREELTKKKSEAAEKWTAFSTLREQAKSEGHDLTSEDSPAFKKLDEAHRDYATVSDHVKQLEEKLFKTIEWETGEPPKSRDSGDDDDRGTKGVGAFSPGLRVVGSDEYKRMVESGILESNARVGTLLPAVKATNRDELKALLTGASRTSSGAFIEPDRQAGFIDLLLRPLTVRNLVTVGDTDSDIVEWVREDTFTNAAAETAEATATTGTSGTKPESALAYSVVQSNVRNIAHWIPATKRALADVGQLRTLIDQRLRDGVDLRLDSQMINGDGTGENLRGILNTSGILSQSGTGMPAVEALLRAITLIRLQFLEPTAILMHPNDFMGMRLAQDANGNYIFGPPNVAAPAQVWGVPIAQSTVIAENTAIVGKWNEAILWVREGATVSASDSHSDFFVRNMVAVLAEGRFAFGVPRPAAFCQVTAI